MYITAGWTMITESDNQFKGFIGSWDASQDLAILGQHLFKDIDLHETEQVGHSRHGRKPANTILSHKRVEA
jgi:hypothetical protein